MRYVKFMVLLLLMVAIGIYAAAEIQERMQQDASRPEITSDMEVLELPCGYTEEQLLAGLHAEDPEDGDITSKILVGEISRFIDRGEFNVTYIVFDSANHSASLTRKVQLTDYQAPELLLQAPLVYGEGEGFAQLITYRLGATDIVDGDLTENIKVNTSTIDFQLAGEYSVSVEVSNSYGDTVITDLPVHVVASEEQMIQIELTKPLVYINKGGRVNKESYIGKVTSRMGYEYDSKQVEITSNLDIETPGCYQVEYRIADEQGNMGVNWLTVIVRE